MYIFSLPRDTKLLMWEYSLSSFQQHQVRSSRNPNIITYTKQTKINNSWALKIKLPLESNTQKVRFAHCSILGWQTKTEYLSININHCLTNSTQKGNLNETSHSEEPNQKEQFCIVISTSFSLKLVDDNIKFNNNKLWRIANKMK